jgi:Spy/CpxP family protein refolding chaperone
LDRFADALRLTKPQKSMMKDVFDAAQKEAEPVRNQIQKSRGDIATAIISKKSQQEVDPLLAQYGTLMAQMAGIELRALGQVVDALTPDQQKRVGPVFAQMSGIFSGKNWNSTGF